MPYNKVLFASSEAGADADTYRYEVSGVMRRIQALISLYLDNDEAHPQVQRYTLGAAADTSNGDEGLLVMKVVTDSKKAGKEQAGFAVEASAYPPKHLKDIAVTYLASSDPSRWIEQDDWEQYPESARLTSCISMVFWMLYAMDYRSRGGQFHRVTAVDETPVKADEYFYFEYQPRYPSTPHPCQQYLQVVVKYRD